MRCVLFSMVILALVTQSCRKEELFDTSSDLRLSFSTDSILFDTVFTTLGSTTKVLMVYNTSGKPVRLSSVSLEKGAGSQFRLNVDGVSSHYVEDVEIDGNDSIFVFVKVRIDPNDQNSPLVVSDRIRFVINGNTQTVNLEAWGQDAHYIVYNHTGGGLPPYRIISTVDRAVHWVNDKPYVIYGYAVVDSMGLLTIDPGVRVHFHKNSGLWIYRYGTIKVNGTLDEPVTFQGDRLEVEFQDVPGQWDRIWINEGSVNNVINYAIIKNGFIGVQAEVLQLEQAEPRNLVISNTVIRNMSGWGLLSRNFNITSYNSEYSDCAIDAVYLSVGGSYDFRHCTLAGYWSNSVRQTPSLLLSNYYEDAYSGTLYVGDLKRAFFGNCIIYGNLDEELILAKDDQALFNHRFENCLIRSTKTSDSIVSCLRNLNPMFKSLEEFDFTLLAGSPAIGAGSPAIASPVPVDYFNKPRLPFPDLGAYQYVAK